MVKTFVVLAATACSLIACATPNPIDSTATQTETQPASVADSQIQAPNTPARHVVRIEPTRVVESSSTAQAPAQPTAAPTDPAPTSTLALSPTPPPLPVGPASQPDTPEVRGGTNLPLPAGTTVVWGGCASDGQCEPYNFYWAPTHEVVMQLGEGSNKVSHELCHAHQHWSINGGADLEPSDYDLESWYDTGEGQSFVAAVSGLSWPWSHSAQNGIEDFAWTCGYYYFDAAYLQRVSPERYDWAVANLP